MGGACGLPPLPPGGALRLTGPADRPVLPPPPGCAPFLGTRQGVGFIGMIPGGRCHPSPAARMAQRERGGCVVSSAACGWRQEGAVGQALVGSGDRPVATTGSQTERVLPANTSYRPSCARRPPARLPSAPPSRSSESPHSGGLSPWAAPCPARGGLSPPHTDRGYSVLDEEAQEESNSNG